MRLQKRTYALPPETVQAFDEAVKPGKRSAVVAELMNSWLHEQRCTRIRQEVIEGCRDMAGVFIDVECECHPLEEEVERGLDGGG